MVNWYPGTEQSFTTGDVVPAAPTALAAQFQNDSSTIASGSYLNETAESANNNLELTWTAPAGNVTGYQILDTYPDGTTSIGYQGPNTNGWLVPNGFGAHGNGAYTYQVVAVNSAGDSVPSATFTINYVAPLPAPTDLTPTDGADTSDVNFTQTWSPVPFAAKYDYQVTTSYDGNPDDFTSMGEDFSDGSNYIVTPTLITRENSNAPLQTYYWRVRAIDAGGNAGAWSAVNEVTVEATPVVVPPPADTTPPTVPVQTYPADAATLNTNSFTYTWNASTDASSSPVTYQVQVSEDSAETDGVLNDIVYTSPVLTTNSLDSAGAPDGTYYWQVRATDSVGNTSAWSPIESVTLDTAATSTPPVAPTPSATTAGATNVTVSDAALNGENGDVAASGSSFWVSTSPFVTTSTDLPSGVYSTLDLGAVATDTAYTASLSSLATAAYPSAMPAVTASTTYYYVAWVNVDGTWYPGNEQSFTIGSSTDDSSGGDTSQPITVEPMTIDIQENASSTPITLQVTTPGITGDVAYAITTEPTHGTLSAITDGMVDYTPTTGYFGSDSFAYNAADGTPSTVSISISQVIPVNNPPVTSDVTATSTDDAAVVITLPATDADDDTLTYATTSSPTNGSLSAISGDTVTYTPSANYSGTDSFTFVASDGQSTSTPSTATINVTAPTPVVTPEVFTGSTGGISGSGPAQGSSSSSSSGSGSSGSIGGSTGGQVLGASTYNFTSSFGIGTRDEDVTQLQTILIADGYLGISAPTGYFGPLTKAAVIKYQIARGIPGTGFVGPLTLAALNAGTTPTVAQETASMNSTAGLQAQLETLEAELQAALGTSTTTATTTVTTTASSTASI